MANLGIRRLRKEYQNLLQEKSPVYFARPSQEVGLSLTIKNEWFDWHFTIRGPPDTPYEGGLYHGIITFPQDYPYKPPSIFFLNKSGRFGIREKVCLSFTNFHPEYWQPAWTIENILQGLISFMDVEEEYQSVGAVTSSKAEKVYWAKKSREFECKTCGKILEILPDTEQARKFKVKCSLPAFQIKRKESEAVGKGEEESEKKDSSREESSKQDKQELKEEDEEREENQEKNHAETGKEQEKIQKREGMEESGEAEEEKVMLFVRNQWEDEMQSEGYYQHLLLLDKDWEVVYPNSEGDQPETKEQDLKQEGEESPTPFTPKFGPRIKESRPRVAQEEEKERPDIEFKDDFEQLVKEHETMETALHNFMEKLKRNKYARFLQDKEGEEEKKVERKKKEEGAKRQQSLDEQRFFREIIEEVNRRHGSQGDLEELRREAEKEKEKMKKLKKQAEVRKLYARIEGNVKGEIRKAEKIAILKVVLFSVAVFCCCFCAAVKYKSF